MIIKENIATLTSERKQLCELLKHRLDTISMDTDVLSLAKEISEINSKLKELYRQC